MSRDLFRPITRNHPQNLNKMLLSGYLGSSTLRLRKLKNGGFTLKTHQMISVHTSTPKKFENGKITAGSINSRCSGKEPPLLSRAEIDQPRSQGPPLPTGILYSPHFAGIKRPRWRRFELNDRHLRSHGKIGDCERSSFPPAILKTQTPGVFKFLGLKSVFEKLCGQYT